MHAVFISNVLESVASFRLPVIQALQKRGWKVSCISGETSLSFGAPAEVLRENNVNMHLLPLAPASFSPLKALSEMRRIGQILRQIDADLVFTHTIKPNTFGILACRWLSGRRNRRILATINGLGYTFLQVGWRSGVYRFITSTLYRLSLRYAERVFFFNQHDRELFIKLGIVPAARSGHLPGSGVDVSRIEVTPPAGRCAFLFIGRLIREKGIYEFVDAARAIRQRYPEASFTVVGGTYPSATSVTTEELAKWKSEGTIDFTGPVADVSSYIRDCAFMVLPSYREGLTRSVLEAMACGRAIITTRVPGCEELVLDGENGYLCEAGNVESLVRAMEMGIRALPAAEAMGLSSRRLVEKRYSVEAMLNELFSQFAL